MIIIGLYIIIQIWHNSKQKLTGYVCNINSTLFNQTEICGCFPYAHKYAKLKNALSKRSHEHLSPKQIAMVQHQFTQ